MQSVTCHQVASSGWPKRSTTSKGGPTSGGTGCATAASRRRWSGKWPTNRSTMSPRENGDGSRRPEPANGVPPTEPAPGPVAKCACRNDEGRASAATGGRSGRGLATRFRGRPRVAYRTDTSAPAAPTAASRVSTRMPRAFDALHGDRARAAGSSPPTRTAVAELGRASRGEGSAGARERRVSSAADTSPASSPVTRACAADGFGAARPSGGEGPRPSGDGQRGGE